MHSQEGAGSQHKHPGAAFSSSVLSQGKSCSAEEKTKQWHSGKTEDTTLRGEKDVTDVRVTLRIIRSFGSYVTTGVLFP